jgi:hypothetical protein
VAALFCHLVPNKKIDFPHVLKEVDYGGLTDRSRIEPFIDFYPDVFRGESSWVAPNHAEYLILVVLEDGLKSLH